MTARLLFELHEEVYSRPNPSIGGTVIGCFQRLNGEVFCVLEGRSSGLLFIASQLTLERTETNVVQKRGLTW